MIKSIESTDMNDEYIKFMNYQDTLVEQSLTLIEQSLYVSVSSCFSNIVKVSKMLSQSFQNVNFFLGTIPHTPFISTYAFTSTSQIS